MQFSAARVIQMEDARRSLQRTAQRASPRRFRSGRERTLRKVRTDIGEAAKGGALAALAGPASGIYS